MLQVGTQGANHELLQQRERHCKLQEPSMKQTSSVYHRKRESTLEHDQDMMLVLTLMMIVMVMMLVMNVSDQ